MKIVTAVYKEPLGGFRQRFLIPTIVLSDNFWWKNIGQAPRTYVVSLSIRWMQWLVGISFQKEV